ncbi:MAG TPA: ATP-binding cassette domain-containing protein [Polyangia bacterium]|nr:ATP-binding cassette domain-containing protein [Polyangia bacterium]
MNALDVDIQGTVGALAVRATFCAAERPIVVMGPNGAGKTSLLLFIAGGLRPLGGRVALGDAPLFDAAAGVERPVEQRRIGFVPQRYALFPHLDVLGNVAFGIPGPRAERLRRAREALNELEVGALGGRRPDQLSGGEMQRVALARALAARPGALLLDEPLAALDATVRRETRRFLADRLRAWSLPTVVVTHDPADAEALCGEILVLETGTVVQRGTLDELASAPATAFVAQLLGSR